MLLDLTPIDDQEYEEVANEEMVYLSSFYKNHLYNLYINLRCYRQFPDLYIDRWCSRKTGHLGKHCCGFVNDFLLLW